MRVVLVHNPKSGDDDHSGEHLVELLRAAGHQVRYSDAKRRHWLGALDDRPDLVAIAGGDGTVREVATAAADRGIPVTILPTGTANNIAGWLGLTGIPHSDLAASWDGAPAQLLDLGVAIGPRGMSGFLESVGVGVLAAVIAEIDTGGAAFVNELSNRDARISAAVQVFKQVLGQAQAIPCRIRLDDRELTDDYLMVEVLNFGAAGPNLRFSPHADGADGLLDIVLVGAQERDCLEAHVSALEKDPLYVGTLPTFQARHVTITCQGGLLHVDDELWTEPGEQAVITAEAMLRSRALTFLVPEGATRRGNSSQFRQT